MLSAQDAPGTGTARLMPRPLQSPATSLCRAEAEEIRSPGHTEVRARVRSGFHTLTLWSRPSAVPSRCLWLQQHLRRGCCSQPTREDAASGLQRKETSGLPQKMCPQTDRPVVQTGLDLSSASRSWPITLWDFGSWKMT